MFPLEGCYHSNKGFCYYVCPILQYASVTWSPYHLGEIAKLESIQKRFTKRHVGLHNITYADRINILKLDSLKERWLHFDNIFTYKILFGIINMNCIDMFAFNDFTVTLWHAFKLVALTFTITFCNRVINVWNYLHTSDRHFKTFESFKLFLAAQTLTAFSNKLFLNSQYEICIFFCILLHC